MGDGHDDRLTVRPIAAADTRSLREEVLRPGQPPEASVYPADDDPSTVHFGAFLDGVLVGIASLYEEDRAGGLGRGWRLRGMATAPAARRRGVGQALLAAVIDHVADRGGLEVWCNARMVAVPFYGRAGFTVVGESFDIPGIGPHRVMRRAIYPPSWR